MRPRSFVVPVATGVVDDPAVSKTWNAMPAAGVWHWPNQSKPDGALGTEQAKPTMVIAPASRRRFVGLDERRAGRRQAAGVGVEPVGRRPARHNMPVEDDGQHARLRRLRLPGADVDIAVAADDDVGAAAGSVGVGRAAVGADVDAGVAAAVVDVADPDRAAVGRGDGDAAVARVAGWSPPSTPDDCGAPPLPGLDDWSMTVAQMSAGPRSIFLTTGPLAGPRLVQRQVDL